MRSLAVAVLVVLSALAVGPPSAQAASIQVIGQFNWEAGDPLFGPTFSFEYLSGDLLPNLRLDLETSDGLASFGFNTSAGFDRDQDGIDDVFRSSITDDLSSFTIITAFIRASDVALFLLDPNALETPLLDSAGVPLGLNGVDQSASVAISLPEPPPPPPTTVPEPGTLVLVALGLAGAVVRSRRGQTGR